MTRNKSLSIQGDPEALRLNASFLVHPKIFDAENEESVASGFHRDLFNGLLMANGPQSLASYKERAFAVDLCASTDLKPDNLSKHRKAGKTRGLELLSLLQTGMDVKVDYSNSEELKRLRQATLFHVVNFVCHDR